ncbi:MAG: valine--tRNA ligase [Chloroflexi bacterium]|nr:valine--tRNA ligase [Chloroflexota bacterium]
MAEILSKTFDPQEHEERLYRWWEEQGCFRPEKQIELGIASVDGPSWCITMPPPNVTGVLHLGHALTAAVEDLMTRYYRMRGFDTLFLPGADHAGIATQNVVERELRKEGLTRHDLGRERFVERCWEWARQSLERITEQHKRLGISCDWTRERFTLDEELSHAVRTAFLHLYVKGLIYRGAYLVNWCPRCESAISDLEVEPDERAGHLWYVRYPIVGDGWDGPQGEWGSGQWAQGAVTFIEMATTRPETIPGDSAVAVNPDDPRWKELVGKTAVLPAIGRPIPIIADDAVDPKFGTGAVKVTPAHDPTDNEIGIRHNLEAVNVMTDTAQMNEAAGKYVGQDRFECRRQIVADFTREGLLVRTEDYHHAVGICARCSTDIEPRISTQWFVKTKPLAEGAIQAVRERRTTIVPEREERRFFHWMENIRDWCISRQLWWGHRIPVWYCDDCAQETCAIETPDTCAHCGGRNIHQDEDVLDTWFSSGLWPFSTLGWPNTMSPDYCRYYPTSVRETGYDILFFWVAREMMLGNAMTGETPYATVYLHGLVRNEEGKKISKSMENIDEYDPLNIIDKYGCDALRYTLMTSSTPGLDMNLDPRRLEGARNFTNKVWQAARFVLSNTPASITISDALESDQLLALPCLQVPDRWILSRLNHLIQEVTRLFESYQYGEAGRQIYEFLWGEYCDWYIEASKVSLYDDTLDKQGTQMVLLHVLEIALRLLHPFMPFVTEAIWQALPAAVRRGETVMLARWPDAYPQLIDGQAESDMHLVMELVRGIRNRRAEYGVTPGRRIPAIISAGNASQTLETQTGILCSLAKLDPEQLEIRVSGGAPDQAATVVVGDVVCYLPLAALVDLDAERQRLREAIGDSAARISRSETLLASEFAQKAPPHIVQRERDKLENLKAEQATLEDRLATLG